jgi:hypothetical protein
LKINATKIIAGSIDAEALSAYLAQNLDKVWAAIVTTATTACIEAVGSNNQCFCIQNLQYN